MSYHLHLSLIHFLMTKGPDKAFFQQKSIDICLFLHENICYGYLLEALLMSTTTYIFVVKLEKIFCGYPHLFTATLMTILILLEICSNKSDNRI